MASDRPVVTIAELTRLQEQSNRPAPLTADEVRDYATAALVVLRGMARRDKLRVLAQMRKQLG